jgi:hypothetical protein
LKKACAMSNARRHTTLAATLSLLAAARCNNNQAGDLAATHFGDLSHRLSARGAALAPPSVACATSPGVLEAGSVMRRRPYLQELTQHSLQVVWTADARMTAAAFEVTVTAPDGTLVTRAEATRDASAHPPGAIQWSAALDGLQPDTGYCYQVASGDLVLRRNGFRTPPAPGSGRPLRFLAVGDSGDGGSDQRAVHQQMLTVPFDMAIHLGDIAYEEGTRQQLERAFFDVYADILETTALFPASGNHEYETDDAAPFREAFMLPENGGEAGRERWYSYDWGDVHFVALDSERIGEPQARWLDADLSANHLPWTIAYLHRPPFSSGLHGSNGEVQRLFVPVLVRHRVPLVLAGHDHDYERTRPIDGITYVVSGGGGRGTRGVGSSSFTAFSEAVCHFLYITVDGDELTLHAIDGVGDEFDSLLLRRQP